MDYGEIFSRAAKLIWKFKIFWIFGLLASCAGGSNASSLLTNRFSNIVGTMPAPWSNFFNGLAQTFRQTPGWFIAMALLLVCGLSLITFVLSVLGSTGLARGAWLADADAEKLTFGQVFRESLRYFWKAAGLRLLISIPGVLLSGLLVGLLIFGGLNSLGSTRGAGQFAILILCLGLPLICVLVPVFWLLNMLMEFSTVAITGENLGLFAALQRGWQVLTRNLVKVLLSALLLLVIQIGFGLLSALVLAPLGLGVLLANGTRSGANVGFTVAILAIIFAVPVMGFLNALLYSYMGTTWVVLFRRLTVLPAAPSTLPPDGPVIAAPLPEYPAIPPQPPAPPSSW